MGFNSVFKGLTVKWKVFFSPLKFPLLWALFLYEGHSAFISRVEHSTLFWTSWPWRWMYPGSGKQHSLLVFTQCHSVSAL